MPSPNPAQETVGRYVLVGRLGAGAFGTVYKAFDPQLKRHVALKVPNPGALANPKHAERFLREAQAAAGLRHPNIVPVYDAGRDGDRFYIAAAFIDGRPLADAIPEGGMDPAKAAALVRQLADAVAAAHDAGVVHRDIKPANVLVDAAGVPHLTDFGLAAQADLSKLTNEGAVIGTPHYMAPEQAAGQRGEAKPAADQYALGVVLYELLTGRTPFEGPPASVIYNVLHSSPPPPRAARPDVPAEVEQVCLKAMAKKPENRFADCRAFAAALDRCAAGASGEAAPGETAPPARPDRRRWPVVAAAVGLLVVAAGVTVALSGGGGGGGGTAVADGGPPAVGGPADDPAAKPPAKPPAPPDPDDPPPVGRRGGLWPPKSNVRVTADGVLEATAGQVRFGDPGWTDYVLTCEVQVPAEGTRVNVGVRVKDRLHCHIFNYDPSGHALKSRHQDQTSETDAVKGPLEPGVWYRVMVSAVKDQLVYTMTDTRKKKKAVPVRVAGTDNWGLPGSIVLGTGAPDKGGPVRFRNIKVTTPDGRVLWEEGPPELPGQPAAAPPPPAETPGPKAVDRKAVSRGTVKWSKSPTDGILTGETSSGALIFGDPSWTDYSFSADVRVVSGPPEFGLGVRAASAGQAYTLKVGTEGRTMDLWTPGGGKGPDKSVPQRLRFGDWNHVRLAVVGNRVRGWAGPAGGKLGPPDIEYTGGETPAGLVALGIGYPRQPGKAVIQFKNLEVRGTDGRLLWQGLPDLPD